MVNFITCWLRDPGDLPSNDGPPGGGGTGGPPGGDDGDPPCDEKVKFYGCDPTTLTDSDGDGTYQGACTAEIEMDISDWSPECDISLVPECITLGTGVGEKVCEWCQTPNHPNCLECCTEHYWNPGDGDETPCPAYICEDPKCDPPHGKEQCTATTLTQEQWQGCGWTGPGTGGVEGQCYNKGGGGCSIGEKTYFADKPSCDATCFINCPECPDGYLCQENTGEFVYGNCNQSELCPGEWNPDLKGGDGACEYFTDEGNQCHETKTACLEEGCTCKNFVGCSLGISDNVDLCQQCEVTGAEVDENDVVTRCLFEDLDGGEVIMFEGTEAETTCQKFHDGLEGSLYYFVENKDDPGAAEALCEANCIIGKNKCYKCSEIPCYGCEDAHTDDMRAVSLCKEAEVTGGDCVESGNDPFLNADGEWACLTDEYLGDPSCEDKCESCDDQNLYSTDNCDNQCGSSFPGSANFPLGGNKGFLRVYGIRGSQGVYQRDINNTSLQTQGTFFGVRRGTLRSDLFKDKVHIGIRACIDISNKQITFSDRPFNDLSNRNIQKSIHDDIILKLDLAIDANGRSIKNTILSSIRDLIIANRLDEFDIASVISIANRLRQVSNDVKYQDTRTSFNIRNLNSISNEAKAISLVTKTIWPLTSESYTNTVSERMRYWKTLAPDLEKYLPVKTAEGVETPFYYDINDQIALNTSGTITLSPGDLQRYTKYDGTVGETPIQSLKDRAGVLSIEVLQRVMAILGTDYNFRMTVTTDPTLRMDERYGTSKERKEFYMLTLQTSGIEDLPRTNSFVARTKAKYTYEDSGPARNAHVAKAPFPFLELYVDAQDPIFNYITNDGVIEVESKDFVFDIFNDTSLPVIPRRGPVPTIVLYPTDRTANTLTHQVSRQLSYGVRELVFNINPDPDLSDNWQATYLKERRSFPDQGISLVEDNLGALTYSVNTNAINNQDLYVSGAPTLPRLQFGVRYAYSVAKELKDDYQIPSDDIVKWYEVYERMPIPMMKFMHKECIDFNKFKSLLAIGKVSTDDSVNAQYPKLREVVSQNWQGNQDETTTRLLSYLKIKEDHTPIPFTPLD
tara:strand:+ start:28374 stop:31607 length:3234 start_codon:yes stop_codon:yes gene_type:complete